MCLKVAEAEDLLLALFKRGRHLMTSSVNVGKRKSDGIFGIFGVTV